MPRPLTISEVARLLKKDRVTVRRRVGWLRMTFVGAMTMPQFRALEDSFRAQPTLPRGSLR